MDRKKIPWDIVLGSALLGLAVALFLDFTGAGAWLSGLSDSVWWDAVPWALLVVFWAVIGTGLYRQRRKSATSESKPDHL